jgi:hypothetical protein
LAVAMTASAASTQQVAPEVVLLARVKAHIREAIARLPNYTCLQTVERFYKGTKERPFKFADRINMEVLYIGGAELYAAPGANRIQDENPGAFTGEGLISTGAFALHLNAAFLNDKAQLTWRGEEELDGRRTARWDFDISRFDSGLKFQFHTLGGGSAGIKGSVWVDRETLDVLRLEDHAYDIPPLLWTEDASTTVSYARTTVGKDVLMLPQEGIVNLLAMIGEEHRNLFAFTHCRAFEARSSIRFDPVTAASELRAATPSGMEATALLPAELEIPVVLDAPVTETAAVGDSIEGKTAADIVKAGKVLIPKGAVARGRIRRLKQVSQDGHFFAVSLEFTELVAGSERFQFYADLTKADPIPGFQWTLRRIGGSVVSDQAESMRLPGVGSFCIRGDRLLLPVGFKMVWKTRSLAEAPRTGAGEIPTTVAPRRGIFP